MFWISVEKLYVEWEDEGRKPECQRDEKNVPPMHAISRDPREGNATTQASVSWGNSRTRLSLSLSPRPPLSFFSFLFSVDVATHTLDELFPIIPDRTSREFDLSKTDIPVHLLSVFCVERRPTTAHLKEKSAC